MSSRNYNGTLRRDYNGKFLPIEVNDYELVENNFIMPHHRNEIEIHYIIDGTCDYYIDGKKQSAETGDIVYLKSDTVNSMYKSCEKLKYRAFVFLPGFLYTENVGCTTEKYFRPLKQGDSEVTCVITSEDAAYPELIAQLNRVKELMDKQEELYELEVKIAMLSYFLTLFKTGHAYGR